MSGVGRPETVAQRRPPNANSRPTRDGRDRQLRGNRNRRNWLTANAHGVPFNNEGHSPGKQHSKLRVWRTAVALAQRYCGMTVSVPVALCVVAEFNESRLFSVRL
jgi:hypothetical protein